MQIDILSVIYLSLFINLSLFNHHTNQFTMLKKRGELLRNRWRRREGGGFRYL